MNIEGAKATATASLRPTVVDVFLSGGYRNHAMIVNLFGRLGMKVEAGWELKRNELVWNHGLGGLGELTGTV